MTGSFHKKKKNENSTQQSYICSVHTTKELALVKVLAKCKHFPDTPPMPTLASLLASHCGMLGAEVLRVGRGSG